MPLYFKGFSRHKTPHLMAYFGSIFLLQIWGVIGDSESRIGRFRIVRLEEAGGEKRTKVCAK